MNYEKSLNEILGQLKAWKDKFIKLQEELLGTMEEIDKDIGFALENKDVEQASFLQWLFNEIQEVANGTNPLTNKQIGYVISLIEEKLKEGEHGEEHKATAEA